MSSEIIEILNVSKFATIGFMLGGLFMFLVLIFFMGASDRIYSQEEMNETTSHYKKIIKEMKL